MTDSRITRRSFLGFGAAALAGVGLAACAPQAAAGSSDTSGASGNSAADVVWTQEADVVVVGFGGAGAAAAIEAQKAGAQVIVLEKASAGGGSTLANGGFIMMGGTKLQKKFGLEDSTENFYNYLVAAAGENANKEAIRVVADASPGLYDWCVECGMDFESGKVDTEHHLGGYNAGISLGYSGNEMAADFRTIATPVPRGHMPQPSSSGTDMFAALQKTVEAAGIEVLTNTGATALFTDDSGRVVGVAAGEGSKEVLIKANKGVVMAAGGFTDNDEMVAAYYPYTNVLGIGRVSSGKEDGSGILMGMAVGADTYGMGCFQIGRTVVTSTEPLAKGVIISEKGRRIVAEDEYNSFMGKALVQAPTANSYLIVPDAAYQEADKDRAGEPLMTVDSLDEVAPALGINADVARSTFDFYNASAAAGNDREFGKDPKFLVPLETGPFHVFYVGTQSFYTGSLGGLKIDLEARVLNLDGEIIPGLYAAGRNSGSIYGWYMGSGSSMADVLTFGRIAGKNAAAE